MKSRGIILLALSTLIVTGCELGGHPVNYSGDTLLLEDFNDYPGNVQPDGWEFIDDPECSKGPSSWYTFDPGMGYGMALSQWSEIYGGGYDNAYYGTIAYTGQDDWTDYLFTCEFFTARDDGVGIDFRVDNGINGAGYYRLFFMRDPTNGGPFTKLLKYDQATDSFLPLMPKITRTYEPNQWNKISIEAVGKHIECKLDDTTLFVYEDADITKGKIGLFCYYMQGIYFDNIEVTALDENGNEGNRLF